MGTEPISGSDILTSPDSRSFWTAYPGNSGSSDEFPPYGTTAAISG